MRRLWGIDPAWGVTVVRVAMGIILFVAGWQKFMGGMDGVTRAFTGMAIPLPGISGPFIAVLDDDGRPVAGGQAGELHVRRTEGMFDGYYRNETATRQAARGEWLSVGDVAWIDAEGFVYICDRKRDMIISGGVNIYPAEIEDALHRHPGVLDVAVFGVPDDEWGERVHAAVQPRPGVTLAAADVIAFARERLAGYKVPRAVSFHEAFPRDSAGKLVKRVLREPYWAGRSSRI